MAEAWQCVGCQQLVKAGEATSAVYPGGSQARFPITAILFCPHCGLGVAEPMLSDTQLSQLYAGGEYWQGQPPEITPQVFPVPFAFARARWRLIQATAPHPEKLNSLLDIGAGTGCLGLIANESRPIAYTAVEPDPKFQRGLQNAWQRASIQAPLAMFTETSQVQARFDVIVLSHLLEHLPAPRLFLESLKSRLTPEGVLFLDVPHRDDLYKSSVFPHLLFFDAGSLRALLESLGWRILHLEAWGDARQINPLNAQSPWPVKAREWLAYRLAGVDRQWQKHTGLSLPGLPADWFSHFMNWHFGANQTDPHGTALRAVAVRA